MRPPICIICHKRFHPSENAGLLHFVLSADEKENNKRFEKPGFVGHPEGQEWFCEEHYPLAIKYRDLTKAEAVAKIREELPPS